MQKAEKRFDRPNKEYAVTPERLREIATGAVLRGDFLTEETQEVAYALFAYADLLKAQAPPEATATQYDELAKYSRDDGLRDWVSVGAWLHPGERIVIESPAEPSAPVEPEETEPTDGPPCDCDDPTQCWEPCGDLGKSADHVRKA